VETYGELVVTGDGLRHERGGGVVVALPAGANGVGTLHWLIKGSLLGKPRTGQILGNFLVGIVRKGDTVVVRYATNVGPTQDLQMQLAYRGKDAPQLERTLIGFLQAWKDVIDEHERVDREAEANLTRDSRPFDETELTALRGKVGDIEIWSEPDESLSNSCALRVARLMRDDEECADGAATYLLRGLFLRRHPDHCAHDVYDDMYLDDCEEFVLCARCIRELDLHGVLARYGE
jgi:hypothetical protein